MSAVTDEDRGTANRLEGAPRLPPGTPVLQITPELQRRLQETYERETAEAAAKAPPPGKETGWVPVWRSRQISKELPIYERVLEWEQVEVARLPARKPSPPPRPAPRPQKPPAPPAAAANRPVISAEDRKVADPGTGARNVPQPPPSVLAHAHERRTPSVSEMYRDYESLPEMEFLAKYPHVGISGYDDLGKQIRYDQTLTKHLRVPQVPSNQIPVQTVRAPVPATEPSAEVPKGPPVQNIDDADYGFLADLFAAQGSEPISPRRAQAIEDRYGFSSRSVTDPEAAAQALVGFELVLLAASFVPPLALPADVVLVLLGFLKGRPTEGILSAATIPFGLLKSKKAIRLVESLLKPAVRGTRFVARSIDDYKRVARVLLRNRAINVKAIAKATTRIKSSSDWGKAAKKAAKVFRETEWEGYKAATDAAGKKFHEVIGAAKVGPDFETPWLVQEVKTHYGEIMDEFTFSPGDEKVLAYLLRDLVEKGVTRGGRVIHVFIKRNGEAMMVTVDALDGRHLIDVVNAVLRK